MKAHGEFFDIRYIPFNRQNLLRNPDAEIQSALDSDAAKDAKWFRVAVGKEGQYSIASPRSKSRVKPFIRQLMEKYVQTDETGKELNNFWGNWLDGLLPMNPKNQTELKTFLRKESKIKERKRKDRKRAKRNAKKNSGMR